MISGNNVMLDLETLGTSPGSAILSIGAVRFGSLPDATGSHIYDRLSVNVSLGSCLDAGLTIDADTFYWWLSRSEEARSALTETAPVALKHALEKFADWIGPKAKVWGNGADFDNAILAHAYWSLDMRQPWRFVDSRCYRTVRAQHPDIELDRIGVYHRAVDDAESQARHLIKIFSANALRFK